MGEAANRIHEVGEPGLDLIRTLEPVAPAALARELDLDLSQPIVLAAQHPVTTEAESAGWQIVQTLDEPLEVLARDQRWGRRWGRGLVGPAPVRGSP